MSLTIQRSGVLTQLGKVQHRFHHDFVRFYACNPVLWRLCAGDLYCSNQPLLHVTRDGPLADALAMASDVLFLSKELTRDAAFNRDTDRHIWAAHYLTAMSKAVIDDVAKVLDRGPDRATKSPKSSG